MSDGIPAGSDEIVAGPVTDRMAMAGIVLLVITVVSIIAIFKWPSYWSSVSLALLNSALILTYTIKLRRAFREWNEERAISQTIEPEPQTFQTRR